MPAVSAPIAPTGRGGVVAMLVTSASAVPLIALQQLTVGIVVLVLGLAIAFWVDRQLARTLGVVAVGLIILSVTSLEARLGDLDLLRFTLVLGGAVVLPTLLARWFIAPDAVRFPVRGRRWTQVQWWYLAAVIVIAYLLLPFYFIGSGAYRNWPEITTANEIGRLFFGVNAVGIWDELFFICIVFALYRRHVLLWTANLLQAIVFVSFLWELGYRSWGPLLTIPFALVQGWIFARTASLGYVVTVHLLFDAMVFLVLVHAHNPQLFDWFVTIPG